MSRIRFATAREVFDAFPSAVETISTKAGIETPLAFVETLAAGPFPDEALAFCAFMLPRREAVWWGCKSVSAMMKPHSEHDLLCLSASEAWVREPDDVKRRAALAAAESGDANAAHTWLAFAAGWSGGSVVSDGQSVPPPAHLTAVSVRVAVMNALGSLPPRDRAQHRRACIDGALSLAGLVSTAAGR